MVKDLDRIFISLDSGLDNGCVNYIFNIVDANKVKRNR